MIKCRVPKQLWDYGMTWECEILSRISSGHDGRTGFERLTGDTPDISEWTGFSFHDICWYWDTPGDEDSPIGR